MNDPRKRRSVVAGWQRATLLILALAEPLELLADLHGAPTAGSLAWCDGCCALYLARDHMAGKTGQMRVGTFVGTPRASCFNLVQDGESSAKVLSYYR